jgi:hypothetical protein
MSGHRRQGIDSTAFDSLLTMSNPTIKLVLILKKINTNFPALQLFRLPAVPSCPKLVVPENSPPVL